MQSKCSADEMGTITAETITGAAVEKKGGKWRGLGAAVLTYKVTFEWAGDAPTAKVQLRTQAQAVPVAEMFAAAKGALGASGSSGTTEGASTSGGSSAGGELPQGPTAQELTDMRKALQVANGKLVVYESEVVVKREVDSELQLTEDRLIREPLVLLLKALRGLDEIDEVAKMQSDIAEQLKKM
ncbi:hypothetical protein FOA52_015124 [Chlamydomonas sp. UWO 241]|nr:hypothetical protein FOA52_015124 [Chlamydomonas sp. UWO 241]